MSDQIKTMILKWVAENPRVFAVHEEGTQVHLMEFFSGKQLKLTPSSVESGELKQSSVPGKGAYLVMLFDDGHQLVLCQQGFAFSPDFTNSGPMELPVSVFCMADYERLYQNLKHTAYEHPEQGREAIGLVMVLIALLDGARSVGLDVERETQRVESILEALENQRVPESVDP